MQTLIPEVLMSKKKMICFTWLLLLSLGLNQSGLIRTCFSNLGNGSEHVTSKEKTSELGFKYLLKKKKKTSPQNVCFVMRWMNQEETISYPSYLLRKFKAAVIWVHSASSYSKLQTICKLIFQAVLHALWKERNLRLHSSSRFARF